ncbi:B-cell scaffold protein with ankyrin repeats [Tupaia chinensis]|uniref:B-cell scaffold protein with ankyrin repeats n=1 Tax=Tupaia chinensis TaxID=246437 RepID=UPI000FFBCD55|nr:B-cell scaffold protein with ankyrin repeats [Tupaia chinensis]
MSHGRKCTEERKSFLYRKAAAATTRVREGREGREGRQGARRSFLLPSGLLTAVSLGAPQAPGVGTIESHLRKNQSGEVTEAEKYNLEVMFLLYGFPGKKRPPADFGSASYGVVGKVLTHFCIEKFIMTLTTTQCRNTKDIIVIYEEDAEEWALYLREVFLHVVRREAILLYRLENFSLRHLELLSLHSYKCKLLILSDSLLKGLTPKKCQFLENVLHSPRSVVTLLCGVKSSDQLYKLLNLPRSRWEISTEQEPEDYISVIEAVISGEVSLGSEEYLEINIPPDLRAKPSGEVSETLEKEELLEASRSTLPRAVVLPVEIPCENPGEIFIILREEVIGDTVEVEFASSNECIRTQPALWSQKVWCMKALDFPAGPVSVHVYCDGVIQATAEIKYYPGARSVECPCGMATPGAGLCQNGIEELDSILAFTFKHEIPYYEFQALQSKSYLQEGYTHFEELPTLLHCAAKFGLKNLALHLLQCSGAAWASQMKNMEGSDPARVAERHGQEELMKIFEDFSIQEDDGNNEQENDYEEESSPWSAPLPYRGRPAPDLEARRTRRPSAEGAEAEELAGEGEEGQGGAQAWCSVPGAAGASSENQDDDLYVFIPGADPENNSLEEPVSCRPPLPPPRPGAAALPLEKSHSALQEGSQNWCHPGVIKEGGDALEGEEQEEEREKGEDPYTFAEIHDSEYDLILANRSIKERTGSRSFILNRPPAPTPRPTSIPLKEDTMPYIAQVFQQKTARRQSDGDKFHGLSKKPDRARIESPAFSTLRGCLAAGQEELILLQEKVKNGKMSVDEALEKFKHWQMGQSGLEIDQQEKLRQLRDCIIGKRPEEENVYDKLTIVHHPSGNETSHNESVLYSMPFNNKLPARLQIEKEFGFCCKKDH